MAIVSEIIQRHLATITEAAALTWARKTLGKPHLEFNEITDADWEVLMASVSAVMSENNNRISRLVANGLPKTVRENFEETRKLAEEYLPIKSRSIAASRLEQLGRRPPISPSYKLRKLYAYVLAAMEVAEQEENRLREDLRITHEQASLEDVDPELDSSKYIRLSEGSEFYNIPKSYLTKARCKKPGEPGFLRSWPKGRKVYFLKEDLNRLARSRLASAKVNR